MSNFFFISHTVLIFILNIVLTVLIDCIVCEMSKEIINISFFRTLVSICREPGKTIVEKINSEWVNSENEDIHPEVKFETIDKVRVVNICLGNYTLLGIMQVVK